jgi:DNA-binding CsgD family transcriptional regulator
MRAVRAQPDSRVTEFEFGAERMAVLSFPLNDLVLPASLTGAEREVARALIEGRSNAEIAKARRTSPHTVANQISALFHKLNVGSRSEFLVAIARPKGS